MKSSKFSMNTMESHQLLDHKMKVPQYWMKYSVMSCMMHLAESTLVKEKSPHRFVKYGILLHHCYIRRFVGPSCYICYTLGIGEGGGKTSK